MDFSLNKCSGTVRRIKPLSQSEALLEFENHNGVFLLKVNQIWMVDEGDDVTVAFFRNQTGANIALSYRNDTKDVKGWSEVSEAEFKFEARKAGWFTYHWLNSEVDADPVIYRAIYLVVIVLGGALSFIGKAFIIDIPLIIFGWLKRKSYIVNTKSDGLINLEKLDNFYQEARELIEE